MLIPLIGKDPTKNDFTCRDGEIETAVGLSFGTDREHSDTELTGYDVRFALEDALPYPTATIRVPLQSGDGPKCSLMLAGEISRVDAASADRITQAIVAKGAEAFADILADARASGLFMLPFRAFACIRKNDCLISYPSAQAILLPADFPPHPEITASHVDDDGVTLSLRIPVRPQRLMTSAGGAMTCDSKVSTYVSRSLWVPDAKDISGSLGSVRSAAGGSVTGIRFSFMSESRLKGSVVAPDKYYRYIGNGQAGFHISSEIASRPDYGSYIALYGKIPPFPADALLGRDSEANPLDWIADWRASGIGYLPMDAGVEDIGFDSATASIAPHLASLMAEMRAMTGYSSWLLTRPMTFARDAQSRRLAEATALKSLKVYGLSPGAESLGVLLGSSDGATYEPVMTFSPSCENAVLAPRRPFWRLLIGAADPIPPLCLDVSVL